MAYSGGGVMARDTPAIEALRQTFGAAMDYGLSYEEVGAWSTKWSSALHPTRQPVRRWMK